MTTSSNTPFLDRMCGGGERILLTARLPVMTILTGCLWALAFMVAGTLLTRVGLHAGQPLARLLTDLSTNPDYHAAVYGTVFYAAISLRAICTAIGLAIAGIYITAYFTTHVALTNKRLLVRYGLLAVKIFETDLEEIKGEQINHGLFGRFFNYGRILLDARFVGDMQLPFIHDPYRLIRALHETRTAVTDTISFGIPLQLAPKESRPYVRTEEAIRINNGQQWILSDSHGDRAEKMERTTGI